MKEMGFLLGVLDRRRYLAFRGFFSILSSTARNNVFFGASFDFRLSFRAAIKSTTGASLA
jgi:hypothetical protein